MSLGILGHSPIPEEEAECEAMLDDAYPEASIYTPFTSSYDDYKITTATTSFNTAVTSSYMSSGLTTSTSSFMPSISDPYYTTPSYDSFLDDKIEEEYREDYEEGVLPPNTSSDSNFKYDPVITSTPASTAVTSAAYIAPIDDYYYENSTYPMTSKLSTIPETAHDVYLSNNDLQAEPEIYVEQLATPGAYDYTENENDYIASGDLKNTNLYQTNYTSQQPLVYPTTAPTTMISTSSTSASNQQAQPEQKKSRFGLGSLFSDGLNVIGSSVNTIKSTATSLAGGVVGGVVGAAAAAAQTTQNMSHNMSQNMNQSMNQNATQNVQNTSAGISMTTNKPTMSNQPSVKLTKQVSEMYDEQHEEFMDPYGAKQVRIWYIFIDSTLLNLCI